MSTSERCFDAYLEFTHSIDECKCKTSKTFSKIRSSVLIIWKLTAFAQTSTFIHWFVFAIEFDTARDSPEST